MVPNSKRPAYDARFESATNITISSCLLQSFFNYASRARLHLSLEDLASGQRGMGLFFWSPFIQSFTLTIPFASYGSHGCARLSCYCSNIGMVTGVYGFYAFGGNSEQGLRIGLALISKASYFHLDRE